MGRIFSTLAIAGLAAGSLAGCGEQGVEQSAEVVGFARAIDAEIVEDHWVHYEDEEQEDGCHEVGNSLFGWNTDDPDCFFTFCEGSETTHCEKKYKTVYDYDRLEEQVIEPCPAPIRQMEYKSETPFIDKACIARATGGQRVNRLSRFIIWVRTPNPDYDSENPGDEPATITTREDISPEEWQAASRDSEVTVRVHGGRITSVELSD